MRSTSVLDRRSSAADVSEGHDLLLLWQHPTTREIVPIGRFTHDRGEFTFRYTRAAEMVEGLRPLPGLGDLHQTYRSDRLPAVFEQRVMEPTRPDYAEYLHDIGLDAMHATPWEQIVHSGGERAGDTLQFMQIPAVIDGRARARFLVSGVRHVAGPDRVIAGRSVKVTDTQHESALRSLHPGQSVRIEAEEGNQVDVCACVATTDGVPLGWVPRALSASVRELLDAGPVMATVVRVGAESTPSHLRLVLDLDTPAPAGFEFDREGRWEPVAAQ
ncbi:hypothetical protein [Flexivirga meconopsidis]|uniref:hypothetical protein n=1 Tax=Flexivirga meconopsidis TaxID=2977121 RepID=UPI00223FC294|nr:hypothetical protein [Flexivirga meconopsidis]